jgi:predicted nucleic acid-binding protein
MTRCLVDTGPLVALLNRRDRYHRWARDTLDTVEPPLFTCEAVLSEVCFLLSTVDGGQDAAVAAVESGIVSIDFSVSAEIASLRTLMRKFADVPMSLADACLVRMSESSRDPVLITLDSDFLIYRRNRRQVVPTLMPRPRRRS